jgi:peptidyl-prolyl cis-trans isomerase C
MMIKTRLALALAAIISSGLCLAEDAKPAAPAPTPDTLIATVNGTPYRLDVFRMFFAERIQQTQGQQDQPAFQQQAFNEFMGLIVAAQEAEKRKLQDNPEVQAAIELQRMKVLSNAALAAMAQDIKVTEDELKAAYEQVKQSARTEYKARHILVKDEAEAKKLIKALDDKADFAELAKKHSLGPTGKNGGELDWFDSTQMVKPFADAVAAMKPGTHSAEPVQSQFGWHVIALEEVRKQEPPAFDEAKPQLEALVQRQKLAEQLNEMRNKAMVELNEDIVRVQKADDAETKEEKK